MADANKQQMPHVPYRVAAPAIYRCDGGVTWMVFLVTFLGLIGLIQTGKFKTPSALLQVREA
jgi:hypothetical protein